MQATLTLCEKSIHVHCTTKSIKNHRLNWAIKRILSRSDTSRRYELRFCEQISEHNLIRSVISSHPIDRTHVFVCENSPAKLRFCVFCKDCSWASTTHMKWFMDLDLDVTSRAVGSTWTISITRAFITPTTVSDQLHANCSYRSACAYLVGST